MSLWNGQAGVDDAPWDHGRFKDGFSIKIRSISPERAEFRMTGIDPALANALRRILIAEVPTVAISDVTIFQNTCQIHDENLAHRLGLIPIVFNPDLLRWREPSADFDEWNSVHFRFAASCPQCPGGDAVEKEKDKTITVYSKDLVWLPCSEAQAKRFEGSPPRPVADDIIVAKLAPGQEIELVCKCEKGIGKTHTKWSPVCTASYRLVPVIELSRPVVGDDAVNLKEACPPGVIELAPGPKGKTQQAVVADPCLFNVHRERLLPFAGLGVKVYSSTDDFLFTVESVGTMSALVLVRKAIQRLKEKAASTAALMR
jgi:DNA-directed RNA polymerase I and III subunit RPAC1